jgi:hypothetical protein
VIAEKIQPACVMAIEHAASLTTQEIQRFVREVIQFVNSGVTDATRYLREVREREKAERPIVAKHGLKHGSPDRCVLSALTVLLKAAGNPGRHDFVKILEQCALAADMYELETPGNFYLEERDYHNRVLGPLVHGLGGDDERA